MCGKLNRVLHAYDAVLMQASYEQPGEAIDTAHVRTSARLHFDNLSVDQLDAELMQKYSSFAHATVLIGVEALRPWRDR
jgi:hypothetical protein